MACVWRVDSLPLLDLLRPSDKQSAKSDFSLRFSIGSAIVAVVFLFRSVGLLYNNNRLHPSRHLLSSESKTRKHDAPERLSIGREWDHVRAGFMQSRRWNTWPVHSSNRKRGVREFLDCRFEG